MYKPGQFPFTAQAPLPSALMNTIVKELAVVAQQNGVALDPNNDAQVLAGIQWLVNKAQAEHVASTDPHTQYAKAADMTTALAGKMPNTSAAIAAALGFTPENSAKTFGQSQTWRDLSTSRTLGTIYTNTTQRLIFVATKAMFTGLADMAASVDGVLTFYSRVADSGTASGGWGFCFTLV